MLTQAHVLVGTTPTLIATAPEWDGATIRVTPVQGGQVYIGGANVAASGAHGGVPLAANGEGVPVFREKSPARQQWYAVTDWAGTGDDAGVLVSVLVIAED